YRERRRARHCVRARVLGRPVVLAQDPAGRRAALALGNHARRRAVAQRADEGLAVRTAAAPDALLERRVADLFAADLHHAPRRGDDRREQIGRGRRRSRMRSHGAFAPSCEVAMSVCSTFAAAPLSIASAAIAIPSGIVAAWPAINNEAPALSRTMSRWGPGVPARIERAIAALSAASPPRSASQPDFVRPTSAGCR